MHGKGKNYFVARIQKALYKSLWDDESFCAKLDTLLEFSIIEIAIEPVTGTVAIFLLCMRAPQESICVNKLERIGIFFPLFSLFYDEKCNKNSE